MLPYEIIMKKRDGGELDPAELAEFIRDFLEDRVPDYQMAAFLMAVYFRGMGPTETAALTEIMVSSGSKLSLNVGRITVDKHSTGGVGDKISFPLVPLLASCGLAVPMISGRGLGHTGGTLDKFEAIPGVTTTLTHAEFLEQLSEIGMVIASQTAQLVPADKRIYALRDVTATVDSIPLIAASIMSKKIAEGVHNLVLDVKTGPGAFMVERSRAEELARTMVAIGHAAGMKVRAAITDMTQPLGRAVGNALEINESIDVLRGKGPEDVKQVTFFLAGQLLAMTGVCSDPEHAETMLQHKIDAGEALACFRKLVRAQGGDDSFMERGDGALDTERYRQSITSEIEGYVSRVDPRTIGLASTMLGGGRAKATDVIDPGVGILLRVKLGDYVHRGAELAELVYNDEERRNKALPYLVSAFSIADAPVEVPQLVLDIIK